MSPAPIPTTPIRGQGKAKGMYAELLGAVTRNQEEMDNAAVETVLPLIVCYADRALDGQVSSTQSDKGDAVLEDILRYGGARSVSSLAENRAWLHSVYSKLAQAGDYDEVLMNLACRLFACHGLLTMGWWRCKQSSPSSGNAQTCSLG